MGASMKFMQERENISRPLLSAATQWVTDLFKFIEKAPPFSATILCKDSRVWVEGKFMKSILDKEIRDRPETIAILNIIVNWFKNLLKISINNDSTWMRSSEVYEVKPILRGKHSMRYFQKKNAWKHGSIYVTHGMPKTKYLKMKTIS